MIFCCLGCSAQGWEAEVRSFVREYESLDIAPLHIAYLDNLNNVQGNAGIARQKVLFDSLHQTLQRYNPEILTPAAQLEHEVLTYYLKLHQERLQLEERWKQAQTGTTPTDGLAKVTMGKDWYEQHLKRWLDISVHPDTLFAFGLRESERVAAEMKRIAENSGMDSLEFQQYLSDRKFLVSTAEEVEQAIATYADFVEPQLNAHFPNYDNNPRVGVRRGSDQRLAQVPAFYRNSTFYYNLFDEPFNLRQVAFLYLHEANPGHHYERSLQRPSSSALRDVLYNPGYSEGWAAYVEDLALDLGLYRDEYDAYGKWEWDLIRSVRVALDVGLNYYDWSDEQALALWQQYLPGQDDIAQREIARMKRWPAQVISYKYGSQLILVWKKRWLDEERGTLLAFHEAVLGHGPLPFSILESLIFKTTKS